MLLEHYNIATESANESRRYVLRQARLEVVKIEFAFHPEVVRPGGEAGLDLAVIAHAAEHDHGKFAGGFISAKGLQHIEPAEAGHHEVEQDQIGLGGADMLK